MKIQSVHNYQYNHKFTGATVPHYHIKNTQNNDNEPSENKPLPEWARKGMLALLVFFAVKNDPAVQNLMTSDVSQREIKSRNEYFEDVRKLGSTDKMYPAVYHLNRLADVDNIEIQSKGRETYNLKLNLDNINADILVTLSSIADNTLSGAIKIKNGKTSRFNAVFSDKNPDEFELQIRNPNNEKITLGRTPKGEFYQIKGKKKVILNKKNVENYQKITENLPNFEEKQGLKFFTNENDMLRKLNLIILTFLLFAEMAHDNAKRKNKKD